MAPSLAPSPTAKHDFLHLTYRPDLHLLVARWQRPASADEVRAGYAAMLELAEQVDCPFWQIDVRGRKLMDGATSRWLIDEFLPLLADRLTGPASLGYLLTPAHMVELASPAVSVGDAAQVALFTEEGPLTAWLAQQQPRPRRSTRPTHAAPKPATPSPTPVQDGFDSLLTGFGLNSLLAGFSFSALTPGLNFGSLLAM